ncbi:MAG: hypothetical protein ABL308_12455 [Oceanicaulis sp.]
MTKRFRSLLLGGAMIALAAPAYAQTQTILEDERTTLAAGVEDPGVAAWNMERVHAISPPPGFYDPDTFFSPTRMMEMFRERQAAEEAGEELPPLPVRMNFSNTDIAFTGDLVVLGNYHGVNFYDTSVEGAPEHVASLVCPGGQGDVSIHGDLMFMSVEENKGRLDCGVGGVEGEVSAERFRGIRIFDISDLQNIRQVAAVQTCRGSHTHTLVPNPDDPSMVYIYNSATSGVRATDELEICSTGDPEENPETALYSIDVIAVPLDAPENAAIVNRPRIFADRDTGEIAGLWRGGRAGVATQRTATTNHCHDITVYPELGIAAGACSGNGILLDISDPENPARLSELFDPDMAYWHSATFNNTGDTVIFTDEWGGGIGARCRAEDPANWGANLVAKIDGTTLQGVSFFKLPSVQGEAENCVAHNGSLVPIPGRDIFVQSWYQGGISIIDFTDPANLKEIAYFDQGPVYEDELILAGYWSAYWRDGKIYGSEIVRGLHVFELLPSDMLSEAELAAAMQAVEPEAANVQTQTAITWNDHPDVAHAYLDQLARGESVDAELIERAREAVARWEDGRPNRRGMRRLANDLSEAMEGVEGRDAKRMAELSGLLRRAAS